MVLERGDDLTWLSLRNVDTVHLLAVDQLNTYDVLLCDDVVFTKAAYDAFVGAGTRGSDDSAGPVGRRASRGRRQPGPWLTTAGDGGGRGGDRRHD